MRLNECNTVRKWQHKRECARARVNGCECVCAFVWVNVVRAFCFDFPPLNKKQYKTQTLTHLHAEAIEKAMECSA